MLKYGVNKGKAISAKLLELSLKKGGKQDKTRINGKKRENWKEK